MPRGVLQRLRCWHAPRVAARFSDEDWPPAEIVRRLIAPGDTVVDVGANMGYITSRLAEYVGLQGRVYAVEPVPDTFASLEQTVRGLGLNQVEIVHACASDRTGQVQMAIPNYANGGENLYESHVITESDHNSDARHVEVPAIRLDELRIDGGSPVVFMKIDVEGHEGEVIRGARDILTRSRPALLIEVAGDPDDENGPGYRFFQEMRALGYSPYCGRGGKLHARAPGERAVDYFFLQPTHWEKLGGLSGAAKKGRTTPLHRPPAGL